MPADAFYEWQKLDAKNKQPFAIAMKDGQPYALAGLWEKWKDRKAGTELLTFTVITTDPNAVVEPLHDRMPVIIPERDYDCWLRAEPDRPPIDLLRPFDAGKMTAWKVDKAVGNVKNDRPELIEPADDAIFMYADGSVLDKSQMLGGAANFPGASQVPIRKPHRSRERLCFQTISSR